MPVRQVNENDFNGLEISDNNPLHSAVKAVCDGLRGDALWEKIREKHNLGHSGDGPNLVLRMNAAINLWNNANPSDCEEIAIAFGV